jgi:hypothetical protein
MIAFGESWTQTFLGWLGNHPLLASGATTGKPSRASRHRESADDLREPLVSVTTRASQDDRDGENVSRASGPWDRWKRTREESPCDETQRDESMMTNDRLATCLSFTARIEAISPRARQYELREN